MKELYRRLGILEERLGFRFRDPGLLVRALTHRSYAAEKRLGPFADNERLEFLGDAVLSAVISHLLYERFPDRAEGDLSRMRAWLIREERLARLAERLGLPDFVLVSRGEERSGGQHKASILAGALEAVIGAVYLDGGYGRAFDCLKQLFGRLVAQAERGLETDYRSRLQELTQARFRETPIYRVVAEEGPPHAPCFEVEVVVNGRVLARGRGRSKKEAAQEAARRALQLLDKNDEAAQ
ncbi:ribonuclease III [Thermosulfurimonas sp. F29]|uniref:ribonuclease III n=1 Tax=Thermosulfurimonas sp. F29 TaxID=2867247 RepID=UPI001C82D0E1|nr:ribonuclease III [Thermosulfurimonas sp. F29]MBX6422529.1 ribonuclease III [Thermosulfurimonas sp. F29]